MASNKTPLTTLLVFSLGVFVTAHNLKAAASVSLVLIALAALISTVIKDQIFQRICSELPFPKFRKLFLVAILEILLFVLILIFLTALVDHSLGVFRFVPIIYLCVCPFPNLLLFPSGKRKGAKTFLQRSYLEFCIPSYLLCCCLSPLVHLFNLDRLFDRERRPPASCPLSSIRRFSLI